jgi:cytochrome c oxidase subunit 2
MRLIVSTVLTLASVSTPASAQPEAEAGRRSYEVCAGCHGFIGEGSRLVGAPRLAGLAPWYLERQIQNFKAGRRGHVEGDENGRRMALLAQAVEDERELGDLVAWIGSLPLPAESAGGAAAETTAQASRGQSLYAVCAACHGADGEGNEALGAPGLVSMDRWYFAEQLRAYAEGLRGTHPGDSYGAQMRAVAASFDTEDERQDLASYVATLPR